MYIHMYAWYIQNAKTNLIQLNTEFCIYGINTNKRNGQKMLQRQKRISAKYDLWNQVQKLQYSQTNRYTAIFSKNLCVSCMYNKKVWMWMKVKGENFVLSTIL